MVVGANPPNYHYIIKIRDIFRDIFVTKNCATHGFIRNLRVALFTETQEDDVDEDALLDILEEDAQNLANSKAQPVDPNNPRGFV